MANPTTLVSTFTDSLDFTDASGTGQWTGVDPIRYDSGLWVEQATTNLIPNPNIELTTNGWGGSSSTVAQSSAQAYVGSNSLAVTATGANAGASRSIALAASSHFAKLYIYHAVGANRTAYIRYNGVDGTGVTVPSGQWTEVTRAITGTGSGSFLVPKIGDSVAAEVYYFDAIQVEALAYGTSYADGAQGDGYAWTGGAHDSTSTRAASSVSVDQDGTTRIDPASGSIAFRYTRNIDTAGEEIILTSGVVGSGTDYLELGIDSTDHFYAEWNSNNAGANRVTSTGTISVDTEYLLYTDWDGTAIRVSIDNGAFDTDTRDAVEGDWSTGDLTIQAA